MYMPFLIAIALPTRSIYRTVAAAESKVAFYLLDALPEWLVRLFFAPNGIVPEKKEVVPPTPGRNKVSVDTFGQPAWTGEPGVLTTIHTRGS